MAAGMSRYDDWKLEAPPSDPEWLLIYQSAIEELCMYSEPPRFLTPEEAIEDLEDTIIGLQQAVREIQEETNGKATA